MGLLKYGFIARFNYLFPEAKIRYATANKIYSLESKLSGLEW